MRDLLRPSYSACASGGGADGSGCGIDAMRDCEGGRGGGAAGSGGGADAKRGCAGGRGGGRARRSDGTDG
jgi:hypothetical protein